MLIEPEKQSLINVVPYFLVKVHELYIPF